MADKFTKLQNGGVANGNNIAIRPNGQIGVGVVGLSHSEYLEARALYDRIELPAGWRIGDDGDYVARGYNIYVDASTGAVCQAELAPLKVLHEACHIAEKILAREPKQDD